MLLCLTHQFNRSRREFSVDVAGQVYLMENYRITYHPRFSFTSAKQVKTP